MCGIVGILPLADRPAPPPPTIRRMAASIDYRGPDDSGELIAPSIHLAAVRLAIVDPKNGSQPVASCDGRISVVYNGELYNLHELRAELRARRHRLVSDSDTELIPHLIEDEPDSFQDRLRGMFAIAAWNERTGTLTLVRDRVGMKPLYFARTPDYVVFASELKAIVASGLVQPAIDLQSLDDLLSISFPLSPRTLLKGIREVRPGSRIDIHKATGEIVETRYWRPSFPLMGEHERISEPEAIEELSSLLRKSVYEHLVGDVPVAAYLSGGLDSSLIAGLVRDVTGDPPRTFSISFDSAEHDESSFALDAANFLTADRTVVKCTNEIANQFERMIWHVEMPLQFPLALPLMNLAETARVEGYRVVLTGEGADEIFGGYDCFKADKMRRLLDRPGLRAMRPVIYRQLYKWHSLPRGTVDRMIENQRDSARIAREFGGHVPPWYDMWTTVGLDRHQLLGTGGRDVRPIDEAPSGFHHLLPDRYEELHPFDAGLAFEQAGRLPSWILMLGDRAAMSAGVEARMPFLDHRVVEFVNRLPPSMKMKGFSEKSLLRRLGRSLAPASVLSRPKQPFFTPIREWFFCSSAPEFVADYLSPSYLKHTGLFDADLVGIYRKQIESVPSGHLIRRELEWTLVLILGMQIFYRQFVDCAGIGQTVRAS